MAQPDSLANSFHRFPSLPSELQKYVWTHAINDLDARVFICHLTPQMYMGESRELECTHVYSTGSKVSSWTNKTTSKHIWMGIEALNPSVLSTNSDSRDATLKSFSTFDIRTAGKTYIVPFDIAKDCLFITWFDGSLRHKCFVDALATVDLSTRRFSTLMIGEGFGFFCMPDHSSHREREHIHRYLQNSMLRIASPLHGLNHLVFFTGIPGMLRRQPSIFAVLKDRRLAAKFLPDPKAVEKLAPMQNAVDKYKLENPDWLPPKLHMVKFEGTSTRED